MYSAMLKKVKESVEKGSTLYTNTKHHKGFLVQLIYPVVSYAC